MGRRRCMRRTGKRQKGTLPGGRCGPTKERYMQTGGHSHHQCMYREPLWALPGPRGREGRKEPETAGIPSIVGSDRARSGGWRALEPDRGERRGVLEIWLHKVGSTKELRQRGKGWRRRRTLVKVWRSCSMKPQRPEGSRSSLPPSCHCQKPAP